MSLESITFVNQLYFSAFEIEIAETDTVGDIKTRIYPILKEKIGFNKDDQIILFNYCGINLPDGLILAKKYFCKNITIRINFYDIKMKEILDKNMKNTIKKYFSFLA